MFANYTTGFCVSAHRLWYLVSSYTRQDRTLLAALPLSLITRRTRLLVRDPLAHISKHLYTCTWEATADTHTHTVAQSRQSVCVSRMTHANSHKHTVWGHGVRVMGQWPLASLWHTWMFSCFPSNKTGLKGDVCNRSWDNVKTNMAHWYRVMPQEVVRGHNGGRQSVGQVVAGLQEDNRKGLIS